MQKQLISGLLKQFFWEEFKQEKSEQIVFETKRYFDKKHFYRKALVQLGIGCAIITFNTLFIKDKLNQEGQKANTRAFLDGFKKTSTVLAFGLSLKGILGVINSFNKDKIRKVETIINPEAQDYNNSLRKTLENSKKDIFIVYELGELAK